jgi:hypothetical protein
MFYIFCFPYQPLICQSGTVNMLIDDTILGDIVLSKKYLAPTVLFVPQTV